MKFKKFKFELPKKHENFAEYFDIAWDKSKDHKTYHIFQTYRNKKSSKRGIGSYVFATIALSAGLLILPGGKINIQRFLKKNFASAGTEIVDSVADIGKSENMKLYMSRTLVDAFLFLEKDELFTLKFALNHLNKLTLAAIEYSDKSYEIILSALNYLNVFIPKILTKEPDFFLDEDLQNSMLNLFDVLIEKSDFKRAYDLLKDPKRIIDTDRYTYEVSNYRALVQGLLIILRYSNDSETKTTCYKLFNKLVSKNYSDLVDLEETFCSIDGLQILLSDLGSSNKEIRSSALMTTCVLFRNDSQAIKLLKTRLLSNLLQTLKEPEYKPYLLTILNSMNNNKKREILLKQSEMFRIEKERLTNMLQDKTVDPTLRQLLKDFLKTS